MAQADGAVRIDTSLKLDAFNKGIDRMVKAMQNLSATTEKLGKTIDSAFSGYVKTLQNAGAAMRPIEAATSGIAGKTEQLSGATDKAAESYSKVAQEADKAKTALSGVGEAGSLDALSGKIEDFKRQISELESAYQGMLSGGEFDASQLSGFEAQLDSLRQISDSIGDVTKHMWTSELPDNFGVFVEAHTKLIELEKEFERVSEESAKIAGSVADIPAPIEEAAQEAQSLESDFEWDFKRVSNQINSVRTEADAAARLIRELQGNAGGAILERSFNAASRAVGNLKASASKLPEAIKSAIGGGAFTSSEKAVKNFETALAKVDKRIQSAKQGLSPYYKERDQIKELAKEFIEYAEAKRGFVSERFYKSEITAGLENEKSMLDRLNGKYAEQLRLLKELEAEREKMTQAGPDKDIAPQYLKDWEEMPTLSGMVSDGFDRIRNSALTAVHAVQHPIQAINRGLALVAQSAIRSGAALLKMASASIINGFRLIGQSAAEAARQITRMTARAVTGGIKRLGAWLSNAAKSMTLFGRSAKRNNGILKKSFTTILKYGLGVRSFYFLFRKVRQAIAEGYQNLARYSDTLNTSISGVISSFKRFENQFAASFEPLVNIVAPAITRMIDGLTEATFRAGEFIAILSGQKTVIRAKEVQEDYAESLDKTKKAAKEAERQLAGFDQLNILKKPDEEETSPEDMFETVPVEDEAKDFADAVKEAWVNVDLSDIGGTIGGKIKVALDNIKWGKIKKAASDMGKRLSTFLNGLINVPELGASIGKALAEAVNTAFAFLDGFAWTFGWKGLGNAIMDAVEAACDNLNWGLINHALQGLAIGLSDLLNTIFSRKEVWEKVGQTIGKGINAAVLFGLTFLERFDFKQAASAIVAGLNAAVATIRFDNIGQLLGDLLGGALQFLYTAVTEFDWEKLGNQIAVGVNAFTSTVRRKIYDINWADIGAAIADGFNTAVIGIEWGGVGETVGMLFGGALTAVASFIRGLDYAEIVQAIQDFFSGAIQQVDFYDLITVWGVAALIVAVKKIIATHPVLALLVGAVLALGPELGNAIRKMVSDIPWEEVGATVGNAFLGALSRINDAIASVNWVEIGEAVGRFLSSINWKEIIGEVFELALNLVAAGFEMIAGFLKGLGAANILKAIGFMIEAVLAGLALLVLASAIKTFLVKAVIGIIGAVVAAIGAGPALIIAAIAGLALIVIGEIASHWEELKEAGGNLIQGLWQGIKDAVANVGAWIKEHIFGPFINAINNLFGIHSPSTVMAEIGGFIVEGLFNGISAAWHTITDFFGGALEGLITTLGGAWEFISGAASTAWNGISTTLGGIVGGIASTIGDTWESVKTATSEKWEQVTTALGTTWESVKTAAGDKFEAVKETVSGAWENIKADASKTLGEVSKTVSDKWNDMKTDASKAWDGLKTSVGQTLSGVKSESSYKVAEIVNDAKTKWDRAKADASNAWNGVKSSVVPKAQEIRSQVASAFTSLQGTLSGVWGSIRSAASGALSSVSATVGSMVSSISSKVSSIQSTVRNVTSATSDALSRTANQMDELARKNASAAVKVGGLASGGFVLDSGQIHKYASGTLRAAGSLFVAGESGPEIVGHVNGRTEVLNESQIAGAIYSAVLAAMGEAVKGLGGFLSQQMAANTNALIAAIGQIQAPQQIAAPQDTAIMERLAALQTVPYQVPAYATGTVMPYEVVAEIRRQTSEITSAIQSEGEEIIQAIVSAISNHGLSITNAIARIPVNQGQSYSPGDMAQYTIDEINRRARLNGRSPLLS